MNIHLGPVGVHAINLSHSGGVDSNMVRRQASHALQAYGHPQPIHAMQAPQVAAAAPNTFGGLLQRGPTAQHSDTAPDAAATARHVSVEPRGR
jgi:hypothetical protein